ncbi:uncharacterized protein A4U43_C07F1180 [Asparagus officinalis]|uniref:Uncharacterized protein n=1 Tax=Asparagus officinalis TaxID=4686 RepID=A0A5P1EAE1_ASPOF|nr:uncharacterized protein A4U43_C07F1180 [Asparagus officinalis]
MDVVDGGELERRSGRRRRVGGEGWSERDLERADHGGEEAVAVLEIRGGDCAGLEVADIEAESGLFVWGWVTTARRSSMLTMVWAEARRAGGGESSRDTVVGVGRRTGVNGEGEGWRRLSGDHIVAQ